MRRIVHAIDSLSILAGKSVSVLLVFAMVIIVYEIAVRTFLGVSNVWAFDLTTYLCGTVYMVGGAYTLCRGKHVTLDLLYSRLSPRKKAVLNSITFFLFALFIGVILWKSTLNAVESALIAETSGTPWDAPIYPVRFVISLGALLILMQGIANFVRDLHMAVKGEEYDAS